MLAFQNPNRVPCLTRSISLAALTIGNLLVGTQAAPPADATPAPASNSPSSIAAAKAKIPHPLRASLVAETQGYRPGSTLWLGLALDIDPDWHTYWPGDNDTGAPSKLNIDAPPGWTVGPLQWPAPKRHIGDGDLLDYVYEGQTLILIPITIPDNAPATAAVTISASATWLVCKDACIPGKAELSLELPPTTETTSPLSPAAPRFAAARDRLPKAASEAGSSLSHAWAGRRLDLRFDGARELTFYPADKSLHLQNAVATGSAKSDRLALTFDGPDAARPDADRQAATGILEVRTSPQSKPQFFTIDLKPTDK